jgi:hypothetical protein
MNKHLIRSGLLAFAACTLLSLNLPAGWEKSGSDADKYEIGIDRGAGKDGKDAATIKSKELQIKGYGALMQHSMPGKYLGQRVRFSGLVKSENVTSWAGLWMRVDKGGASEALSFDNMQQRPIKGTTGWTRYNIVLDVPVNAAHMSYGATLYGTGQIWLDNLKFEVVPKTEETTGAPIVSQLRATPQEPSNLDFED